MLGVVGTVGRVARSADDAKASAAESGRDDAAPDRARFTADDVTLEARTQALSLQGHVDVEAEPFHLTSDALRVTRTPHGLVVDGRGHVAFCPCLGEPVALVFRGATVAPPGDLFLVQPRIEVGRVPVFWLPWFWLRSAGKPGLLPPDVAYRGSDGVFLGEGFHAPWSAADAESGLDLKAGAYLNGGVAVETTLRTPVSLTRVRWDELHQDGLTVDARGSSAIETHDANAANAAGAMGVNSAASVAWDADLIRGTRGVVSTTDLDAAARVFDRAAAEGSFREGGWVLAGGGWATDIRGSGVGAVDLAGPVVRVRNSGALGGVGSYEATVEGGALTGALLDTLSYARADGGAMVASRWGPVGAEASLRGGVDLADQGDAESYDAAASLRGRLTVPLARTFASSDRDDPWRHRLVPEVEAGTLAQGASGAASALVGSGGLLHDPPSPGGVQGTAVFADAGLRSELGQWASRRGFEAYGAVGAVGSAGGADASFEEANALVVRWRAAANAPWFGLGAEGADLAGFARGGADGHVVVARTRVGSVASWSLALLVAGRVGVDPVVARLLSDAPIASSAGFLATSGWTAGARATLPLSPFVTARGGVDGALDAGRLVAVRGSLEVHDRCGCVGVRVSVAERLGRDGVDAWVSVDLVPKRETPSP